MSTNDKSWKFHAPRWQISAELRTDSPLHIGNGESDINNINTCIKDYTDKPYLPATTLKGNLFAWLDARTPKTGEQREDLNALFGTSSDKKDSGMGGRAEFHDAVLITPLAKDGKNYPHWNPDNQTYIDASIAINRHTRTVAHRKLFHTELVPPNVGFNVVITGMMTNRQAALIIAALQAFQEPKQAATLGADDTSGNGRMFLYDKVKVSCMNAAKVCEWLNSENLAMAHSLSQLSPEELAPLKEEIKNIKAKLKNANQRELLQLTIQMDGGFLINNPAAAVKESKDSSQEEKQPDQQPLLDTEGRPLLSGKSLRGALRSQAERIMRTLGVYCCDTKKPCAAIYRRKDVTELCPVCQVFGATGWKSPLHIHHFKYAETEIRPTIPQNFVAIDRFHGGGKHSALFNTRFSSRPCFTGFIELDERMPSWGKGLFALLLRDLHEGDIKLGFGANKGYGGVEKITFDNIFIDEDVSAFRTQLSEFKKLEGFEAAYQLIPDPVNTGAATINPSTPQNNGFHNPYQFIPVKNPETNTWLNKDDLNTAKNQHSHAIYRQKLFHGRLYCKLTAETPFFIGAEKLTPDTHPAKVENYRFNGQLAIPATSLRGMISSLAETVSNSALRVLDNGLLSYRKTMDSTLNKDRPLSAIGMVIGQGKDLKLIPLALPTLRQTNGHYPLPKEFRTMFPDSKAALKVYLNNAYGTDNMATFLENKETWTVDKPEIFYLNFDALHIKVDNNELVCKEGFEGLLRKPTRSPMFVIGQNSEPANFQPVPAHQATDAQKKFWTPGILRILGKEHRADMPDTKKHELFIPVPRKFAENYQQFIQTATTFNISHEAIERFHELADQRTDIEEDLPYHLKGMKRNDKNQLRLKQGDLVYFRPDDDNPNIVAEVSFSAHWRGRVENQAHQAAKVFNFFPRNLLPFNSERNTLSPAELLFGFIEGENTQGVKPENALAFAGKVRIGTGRITSEERLEPETTLKILASPKLPSPALYFRTQPPATQTYIAKHALNPREHEAKGRKQYLHAMRQTNNTTQVQKVSSTGGIANGGDARFPWQTRNSDNAEQKVKITPIQANTTFEFDLDFDNLSAYELGLLCYALKPSDSYRHKLGMGKPIGLGTVNIEIQTLELINRQQRYSEDDLKATRYNGETLDVNNLRNNFIKTMDKDIRQALEILGNPHNINTPVHYPQVRGADIEEETYRWFVANDIGSGRGQHRIPATKKSLTAIDSSSSQLPTLERSEWSDK